MRTEMTSFLEHVSHDEFTLLKLLLADPVGREELGRRTDTSRATCARLLDGLAKKGWVERTGFGDSRGGRRPHYWNVVPGAAVAVGVAVEVDQMTAVVTDLKGGIRAESTQMLDIGESPEKFIAAVTNVLKEILGRANTSPGRVIGVGVSVPGLVDQKKGTLGPCAYFNHLDWWRGFPLLTRLAEGVQANFNLDSQSNAAIVGEHWFGANRAVGSMIYINLEMQGTGVGILVDGNLFRGAGGAAGEFGHMTINYEGRLCRCGNRGCMDAYVSGAEIVRKAVEIQKAGGQSLIFEGLRPDENPSMKRIVEASAKGDHIACGILEETGHFLGIGVASLVNLLNPELVIIGGEVAGAGPTLLDSITRAVNRMALESVGRSVRIVYAERTATTKALGTAAIVLHNVFGSPWKNI